MIRISYFVCNRWLAKLWAEAAPIQNLYHKIKGMLQILKDVINLLPGKYNRYVRLSFGPDNALDFSKFSF